jgi:hypothetical protein
MNTFVPLYKADAATQTIWARAAVEEPDKAREIMDYATARPQFETWSNGFMNATLGKSLGNIRAMHNPRHLAGKVQEIVYDDGAKSVDICMKILDPVDWRKVEEGGYTGVSIGGGYVKKWPDPMLKGFTRYTPRIGEISLVDLPCMDSARFLELHKRDGGVEEVVLKGHPRSFAELVAPPSFADLHKADLHKADWEKVVQTGLKAFKPKEGPVIDANWGAAPSANYVSRGKTFNTHEGPQNLLYHAKGRLADKPVSAAVPKGREVTYTNRGKTFTHFVNDENLERNAAIGDMRKVADPAAKAKIAQTMHEWKSGKLRSWRGKTARGNPRKGPKVTQQRQAIAIALSQARRMGKSAAHPGFADDIVAAIDARLAKAIGDAQNSHITPVHPVLSDPPGKRDGDTTVRGSTTLDWETTRKLNDKAGKKRLDMPGYMTKSADVAAALRARQSAAAPIAEALRIRMTPAAAFLDQLDLQKRSSLTEKLKAGVGTGAGVGALMGGAAAGPGGALVGSVAGGAAGAAGGIAAHGIARHLEARDQHAQTAARGPLSDKAHAQRIGAAKARWLKEGHHDLDQEFDRQKAHAGKAILGRGNKLAAVEQSRGNAWHAVGDAQDAYDKVRKHLPADHHLMMEVPHAHGLLYNPEAVGAKHFDEHGHPDKPLYMLHPAEADDFIKKHGNKTDVAKSAPLGLVSDIRELMAGPISVARSGAFRQLNEAA